MQEQRKDPKECFWTWGDDLLVLDVGKGRGGAPQEETGQPNSSLLTTKNIFQYSVTNMVEPVCNLKIIPVEKQCKVNRLAYFLKTKKNKN